jgi:hypothetical protein
VRTHGGSGIREAGKAFMGRKAGVIVGSCWLGVAAGVLCGTGCTAPRPRPNIADPDPSVSIPGIKIAADRQDASKSAELVRALESDDPAIRFFAIGALMKFTGGERFGYEYYFDEAQRKASVAKWQEWLKQQTPADATTEKK